MSADIDWATVSLTVDDRRPLLRIPVELLDEADAQPSLRPFLVAAIAEALGDPFNLLDGDAP